MDGKVVGLGGASSQNDGLDVVAPVTNHCRMHVDWPGWGSKARRRVERWSLCGTGNPTCFWRWRLVARVAARSMGVPVSL